MFTVVTQLIAKAGLLGVFALMLVENLVPIIPSELILPLAGFEASKGQFSALAAIGAAGLGSALGGMAWYALGRQIGAQRLEDFCRRHGRWIGVSAREVRSADAWFKRWGGPALLLGRALPGVRAVICLPAGVAEMPFLAFMGWSTVGAFIWSALLVAAGAGLGRHYDAIERWMNPAVDALLGVAMCVYLWRIATYRKGPAAAERSQ